jgi:glycosyltransferase involved in cell wall biosynthesis
MPKILRIINRFNIGGPTFNVAYLTKYISKDYETLLIGGDVESGEASSLHILKELQVEPFILKEMQRNVAFWSDVKTFFAIRKIIKSYRPDIVHTHASKAGALGRLAAISCGVQYIVHTFHGHVFHSYFGSFKTFIFKTIERWLAKRTNRIIAISDIQKNELAFVHKIAPEALFSVVPLGFDLKRFQLGQSEKRRSFRNQFQLDDDAIAIGIIGRLVEIKNHYFFIDLVSKITNAKVKFFIVGDGHLLGSLRSYAQSKGIANDYIPDGLISNKCQLIFTSWITETDWLLAGLDIVALTSKNEGTPVSLIEAQAAGKPVITTRVGGVENILPNGYAYCYDPEDFEGYLEGLKDLINLGAKRQTEGLVNSSEIIQKYSYERLVRDMESIYNSL